jgi:hypothetical protein
VGYISLHRWLTSLSDRGFGLLTKRATEDSTIGKEKVISMIFPEFHADVKTFWSSGYDLRKVATRVAFLQRLHVVLMPKWKGNCQFLGRAVIYVERQGA